MRQIKVIQTTKQKSWVPVSRKSGVRATEPLAFFARAGGERMMMAGPAAAKSVRSGHVDPCTGTKWRGAASIEIPWLDSCRSA